MGGGGGRGGGGGGRTRNPMFISFIWTNREKGTCLFDC